MATSDFEQATKAIAIGRYQEAIKDLERLRKRVARNRDEAGLEELQQFARGLDTRAMDSKEIARLSRLVYAVEQNLKQVRRQQALRSQKASPSVVESSDGGDQPTIQSRPAFESHESVEPKSRATSTAYDEPNQPAIDWWKRQRAWKWSLPVVLFLVIVGVASALTGGGHYGPKDAIDGHLSKSCDSLTGSCTSPDAARALEASRVWCRWDGDHVVVHARLKNGMAARVSLSITPKYDIKNGGQHGTSFGGDISLSLNAGESRDWVGDAGSPEGVATGTPISSCKPHLDSIDIG
jgi:hypothetical protein